MFSSSLRAFDQTVRAGSIRKASEALGVAPSSVSRHIALLEREVGTALFERRAGGVELTHAGRLVADYARSVLIDYDSLRTDLDDLRGTKRRLIRLGVVESVAAYGPMRAVSAFLERFPTASFNVRLMPAPGVLEAVRQDQCDIGLAFCPEPDPEIVVLARWPEPVVLLVRADDPLAAGGEVALADLTERRLALPDSDFGVRRVVDRAAAAAGLKLAPVLTSNVFETLRDFVRCGAGVAIVPARAAQDPSGGSRLRAAPLAGDLFRDSHIDLIVLRKRRLPRVLKAFVEMLAAEISQGG